ncbi:MAG: uncharacterized DUF497 family protein [Neolewinella sp.]
MSTACSKCAFLGTLQGLIPKSEMPDDFVWRCMKEGREVGGWPRPVKDADNDTCDEFTAIDSNRSRWEWDENKSKKNLEKHGISFQDAVLALDADAKAVRVQSNSWESLDNLDFEGAGIARTSANTDPVRDLYIFENEENIWVLVSTLRGELALITERVISVRRARPSEMALYGRGLAGVVS